MSYFWDKKMKKELNLIVLDIRKPMVVSSISERLKLYNSGF
jgi:hypothetical protein